MIVYSGPLYTYTKTMYKNKKQYNEYCSVTKKQTLVIISAFSLKAAYFIILRDIHLAYISQNGILVARNINITLKE